MISSAKPIDVVRGTFRRQTKMVFSKVFITFQNVITIAMIAASLTMYLQIDHLIHAPLGYNTTNIIESYNIFRSKSEMERRKICCASFRWSRLSAIATEHLRAGRTI